MNSKCKREKKGHGFVFWEGSGKQHLATCWHPPALHMESCDPILYMLHCMNCSNIFAKAVITIVKHIAPKQLRETVTLKKEYLHHYIFVYPGWLMT